MSRFNSNKRVCSKCGSDKTWFNKLCNSYFWRKQKNGLICNKCSNKEYRLIQLRLNPDYDTIRHLIRIDKERNEKAIYYLLHKEQFINRAKIWNLEHPDYQKVRRLEQYAI